VAGVARGKGVDVNLETFALAGVVVGIAGFAAAFGLLLATPAKREGGGREPVVRFLLLVVFLLYAAASVTLFLSEADMEDAFGAETAPVTAALEDNIETLLPLLAVGVLFASLAAQQYGDLSRGQKALTRSHDLMLDIVDAVPAGIVFLDGSGQITFANDTAKQVLDLVDRPGGGTPLNAIWRIEGADGDAAPGWLGPLVRSGPYDGVPVTLAWPSGVAVDLRVSGRPLHDAREDLGGVVVTFDRPGVQPARAVDL
jgi:PAS domain-containing protein